MKWDSIYNSQVLMVELQKAKEFIQKFKKNLLI